ncbi:MAG: DUF938 domain-containing protein [Sandaracinaceae bacterium]
MFSAACERNREPIRAVLDGVLPASGDVLEIAAGTGMHSVYLARAFGGVRWYPTDADPHALVSIAAWREAEGTPNLEPPRALDVTSDAWPLERADAIFNANMIHISPWACTEGLMRGAGRRLGGSAPLVMYGPYKIGGAHTAESNERFDASLRARDPSWGVRDLEAVVELAAAAGLALDARHAMPANNLTLVFRKVR